MDNDNKIEEVEGSKEVLLFLQDELGQLKKKKAVTSYNLETEYEKTKKNKNFSVWITLFLTVAGVVFATWFITKEVNEKADQVEVNLETFEDINLKNLFDALTKTQGLYETAAKSKAELQAALDQTVTNAKKSLDADLEYIKRLKINKKQRDQRIANVHNKFNAAIKNAHEQFDEKIKVAENEMKQYEEQLKSFDSENVAKAQRVENEMDAQRQFYEVEKTRITEEYEAKIDALNKLMRETQEKNWKERRLAINELTTQYDSIIAKLDPIIKDSGAKKILQTPAESVPSAFKPDSINQNLSYTDEEYTQLMNSVKKKYDDYVTLSKITSNIPYTNGLDKLHLTEQQLAYDMTYSLAQMGAEKINALTKENVLLTNQVTTSNAEIAKYKNSLVASNALIDAYANSINADGFVLNVNSQTELTVYISKAVRNSVKNDGSLKANVIDENGDILVSGALWHRAGVYYLTLNDVNELEILPGAKIQFE